MCFLHFTSGRNVGIVVEHFRQSIGIHRAHEKCIYCVRFALSSRISHPTPAHAETRQANQLRTAIATVRNRSVGTGGFSSGVFMLSRVCSTISLEVNIIHPACDPSFSVPPRFSNPRFACRFRANLIMAQHPYRYHSQVQQPENPINQCNPCTVCQNTYIYKGNPPRITSGTIL